MAYLIPSSLIFISVATAATCYYPAGQQFIAETDVVCNPLAAVSTCCGAGYACLENNLCMKTAEADGGDSVPIGAFIRGSCTDPTFSSPQ